MYSNLFKNILDAKVRLFSLVCSTLLVSQKMASTTPHAYHSLDQTVQELAGKIVVKRRDNESARQVQLDAIEINEGLKFWRILIISSLNLKMSLAVCANG